MLNILQHSKVYQSQSVRTPFPQAKFLSVDGSTAIPCSHQDLIDLIYLNWTE